MFVDRHHAGRRLARALEGYGDEDVLVLAIPRGGVPVGFEVARALNFRFSLLVVRKLKVPGNPETGFGAISEDGSVVMLEDVPWDISESEKKAILAGEREEVERRVEELRGGPLPELKGETVIIVDDGIATGSTVKAGIKTCRNEDVDKLVVAVPVAGPRRAEEIEELVDHLVVLEEPLRFRAVAQVYRKWYDLSDDEVQALMRQWRDPSFK